MFLHRRPKPAHLSRLVIAGVAVGSILTTLVSSAATGGSAGTDTSKCVALASASVSTTSTTAAPATPATTTTTVATVPTTGLSAVAASPTEAIVSWANVTPVKIGRDGTDSTGYGPWDTSVGGRGILPAELAAKSLRFTALVPGATYLYTLTQASGSKLTFTLRQPTTTAPVPTTTTTAPPAAPASTTTTPTASPSISAVAVSPTQVDLRWSNVTPRTVGRDGVDSTGFGAWDSSMYGRGILPDELTNQCLRFNALVPGATYTYTLTRATGANLTVTLKQPTATPSAPAPTTTTAAPATTTTTAAPKAPAPTPAPAPVTTTTTAPKPTAPAPTPPLPSGSPGLGVYVAPANVGGIDGLNQFGNDVGRAPNYAMVYLDAHTDWANFSNQAWILDPWTNWLKADPNRRVILAVPMLQVSSAGDFYNTGLDHYFVELAQNLANRGIANQTIIRLGYEMNGDWMPWGRQYSPDGSGFRTMWRRIVPQMKAAAPSLVFDWNIVPDTANNAGAGYAPNFYPGDDVVDIVGIDLYDHWVTGTPDQRWAQTQAKLDWTASFANTHGKKMSYDEWGLWSTASSQGGGDNPTYITGMLTWATNHNLAWTSYFNSREGDVNTTLQDNPNSLNAFRRFITGG